MTNDEASLVRLYTYLLSKDVYLRNCIIDCEKLVNRKNVISDDILLLWISHVKYQCFKEFSRDVWNILK